jgi:hypothetical protein
MAEYGSHERECFMINLYAAIDPLALLFPTDVYLAITEIRHPNEPLTAHLAEGVKRMSPEQKAYVHTRIRILAEYTEMVSKALGAAHK